MSQRDRDPAWKVGTWEGSRRAQLNRALRLSVRERLEALEALSETSERLAALGQRSADRAAPGDSPHVPVRAARTSYSPVGPPETHVVELAGCEPVPLASYLKALGVFRLVAEQKDPEARAWWENERFYLCSSLDANRIMSFFLEEYAPTPLVAPWGARSGFYPGGQERSARRALEQIKESSAERLAWFRRMIATIENVLQRHRFAAKPENDTEKLRLLRLCRAELEDDLLPWLDACYVLTAEGRGFPPLLGTGGNEGSGSYVSGFSQQVVECVQDRRFDGALRSSLFGTLAPRTTTEQTPGQFSPAGAGGPNATIGFEQANALNPWDYLLCLEGTLLFASAPTRRLGSAQEGAASYPFTVLATGSGTGGAAIADEQKARAEMWLPLWEKPAGIEELKSLFGEGRVRLGRRAARDGLDFARAVASLGADRGISSFYRYGFLQRFGRSVLAIPLDRVRVRRITSVSLVDQLETNGWLTRFRALGRGNKAPARLTSLVRRLEDNIFDLAEPRDEDPRAVQRLLVTLGEAQAYLAVSPMARESCPPVPELGANWLREANDGTPEYRLAAALAGIYARTHDAHEGEAGALPMAVHFAPLTVDGRRKWDETSDARHRVVWGPGALEQNLAAVVQRRLLDAQRMGFEDKPFDSPAAATLGAVMGWLHGEVDAEKIAHLLSGLVLVRKHTRLRGSAPVLWPVPAAYALLKPLFCTHVQLRRAEVVAQDTSLPLPAEVVRHLVAGRVDDALAVAIRRLRTAGVTPLIRYAHAPSIDGRLLLAVLLVPISDGTLQRVVHSFFRELADSQLPTTIPSLED